MEFWKEVRQQVVTGQLRQRAALKKCGLGWNTLKKILAHTEPPGYSTSQPRTKRKLEPFLPLIHEILEGDRRAPRKQRSTAKRIYERLRAEHGYTGGQTVVKNAGIVGHAANCGLQPHKLFAGATLLYTTSTRPVQILIASSMD